MIDVSELRAQLVRPGSLWRQIDYVAETGSTNADLAAAARAGAPPGTVLITDYQSAGRGRLGRTWTAPPGMSIAMSVLLRPAGIQPQRWTWLPLLAGLAVAVGIERTLRERQIGLQLGLKWPNDVLAEGRKLSGILAERVETSTGPACVLGMGINVGLSAAELPVPSATSLAVLLEDRAPTRSTVIAAVLNSLASILAEWEEREDAGVLAEYEQRCTTLGRAVRVHVSATRVVEGRATGLDKDGRLVVGTDSGPEVFGAGDVVHVR